MAIKREDLFKKLPTVNSALVAKVNGELVEVFYRTSASNVIVDAATNQTLKDRLAEIAGMIGEGGTVDEKIKTAVADLINGAPETLDTLKEIADFIDENEQEFGTLTQLVTLLKDADSAINDKLIELDGKVDTEVNRIDARIDDVEDALDEAVPVHDENVPGAVLMQKDEETGEHIWDQVIKTIDSNSMEEAIVAAQALRPGQLGIILLENDPVATIVDSNGKPVELPEGVDMSDPEDVLAAVEALPAGDYVLDLKESINVEGLTIPEGVTLTVNLNGGKLLGGAA